MIIPEGDIMSFVIEDIGENKVAMYEMHGREPIRVPELVMSRQEALSLYDVRGEIIAGNLNLFDDEEDDFEKPEEILDYMGVEEDED